MSFQCSPGGATLRNESCFNKKGEALTLPPIVLVAGVGLEPTTFGLWDRKCESLGDGMVTVTEDAKKVLKTILVAAEADPDEGLRLLPTADGVFALALDTELSGDQVVEYEGFRVLLVGIEYHRVLEGME